VRRAVFIPPDLHQLFSLPPFPEGQPFFDCLFFSYSPLSRPFPLHLYLTSSLNSTFLFQELGRNSACAADSRLEKRWNWAAMIFPVAPTPFLNQSSRPARLSTFLLYCNSLAPYAHSPDPVFLKTGCSFWSHSHFRAADRAVLFNYLILYLLRPIASNFLHAFVSPGTLFR